MAEHCVGYPILIGIASIMHTVFCNVHNIKESNTYVIKAKADNCTSNLAHDTFALVTSTSYFCVGEAIQDSPVVNVEVLRSVFDERYSFVYD